MMDSNIVMLVKQTSHDEYDCRGLPTPWSEVSFNCI